MALKGVLDYYVWRGIPCVRSWPRSPKLPRAPRVKATINTMADFTARMQYQDPKVTADAKAAVVGTNWSWLDITRVAAYGHLTAP